MERKIRGSESEAEALSELENGTFDTQFRELDYDLDVERELEALKSGQSGSTTSGALSSGQPSPTTDSRQS